MSILKDKYVKDKIDSVPKVDKEFEGRDINVDLDILKDNIIEIDKVLQGKEQEIEIDKNMWIECNDVLDEIVSHYKLRYDISDDYEVVKVKKRSK